MSTFAFRVRVRDAFDDEDEQRVYEAFDEEVSLESGPRGHWIGFETESDTFLEAVLRAVGDIVGSGFEPIVVEDELVSLADIAARTGRTRQGVALLAGGKRGPGGFPPPATGNVRSPLWHWADVAGWFEQSGAPADPYELISTLAAVNGALANRALKRERPDELKRIREAIPL